MSPKMYLTPSRSRQSGRDASEEHTAVKSWSKPFGFHTLFYWQPAISGKRILSSYEEAENEKRRGVEDLFQETRRAVEEGRTEICADSALQDLSDIFADVSTPLYIDSYHVSERGYGLVARRVAKDILPLVRRSDDREAGSAR